MCVKIYIPGILCLPLGKPSLSLRISLAILFLFKSVKVKLVVSIKDSNFCSVVIILEKAKISLIFSAVAGLPLLISSIARTCLCL
jgi:hypothetical protein